MLKRSDVKMGRYFRSVVKVTELNLIIPIIEEK